MDSLPSLAVVRRMVSRACGKRPTATSFAAPGNGPSPCTRPQRRKAIHHGNVNQGSPATPNDESWTAHLGGNGATGRCWHRATRRRRPSIDSGALLCDTGRVPAVRRTSDCGGSHPAAARPVPFTPASPQRQQPPDPQQLAVRQRSVDGYPGQEDSGPLGTAERKRRTSRRVRNRIRSPTACSAIKRSTRGRIVRR